MLNFLPSKLSDLLGSYGGKPAAASYFWVSVARFYILVEKGFHQYDFLITHPHRCHCCHSNTDAPMWLVLQARPDAASIHRVAESKRPFIDHRTASANLQSISVYPFKFYTKNKLKTS